MGKKSPISYFSGFPFIYIFVFVSEACRIRVNKSWQTRFVWKRESETTTRIPRAGLASIPAKLEGADLIPGHGGRISMVHVKEPRMVENDLVFTLYTVCLITLSCIWCVKLQQLLLWPVSWYLHICTAIFV